jgi:hypothetical protein
MAAAAVKKIYAGRSPGPGPSIYYYQSIFLVLSHILVPGAKTTGPIVKKFGFS